MGDDLEEVLCKLCLQALVLDGAVSGGSVKQPSNESEQFILDVSGFKVDDLIEGGY